jgi:hypothetical protein
MARRDAAGAGDDQRPCSERSVNSPGERSGSSSRLCSALPRSIQLELPASPPSTRNPAWPSRRASPDPPPVEKRWSSRSANLPKTRQEVPPLVPP